VLTPQILWLTVEKWERKAKKEDPLMFFYEVLQVLFLSNYSCKYYVPDNRFSIFETI